MFGGRATTKNPPPLPLPLLRARARSAINGVPSCGNALLITELFKETWGLGQHWSGGAYVQGDCGAMENLYKTYHYAANMTYAAAIALNAGGDVDCGSALPGNLVEAVQLGLTTEATLDASLTRTYTLQFLAGRFDPLELQPYTTIPFEAIDSVEHKALAYESGVQGLVLLRNDAGLLPLPRAGGPTPKRLALIGPHGNTTGELMGNYFEQRCQDGSFDCVPSLWAALQSSPAAAGYTLSFAQGTSVNGDKDASGFPAALAAASTSDVVILALGCDSSTAQEGRDRSDASLPGLQSNLTAAVLALGKPTVVLLFNGGALAIDAIASVAAGGEGSSSSPPLAIMECFFPGEAGGTPVVDTLFGLANRFGKLPVTVYPASFYEQVPIDQMSMVPLANVTPGRTYKYYVRGPPLCVCVCVCVRAQTCSPFHPPTHTHTHSLVQLSTPLVLAFRTPHFPCLETAQAMVGGSPTCGACTRTRPARSFALGEYSGATRAAPLR